MEDRLSLENDSYPTTPNPKLQPTGGHASWAYRIFCSFLLIVGLAVCWQANQLGLSATYGPGPGFFPIFAGGLLSVLAFVLLIASFRSVPSGQKPIFIERGQLTEMLATAVSVAIFALFVEDLGFVPVMFVVLLILLLSGGCRNPITIGAVAIFGSLGVGYAFTHWLGVYLPAAAYGILKGIGL